MMTQAFEKKWTEEMDIWLIELMKGVREKKIPLRSSYKHIAAKLNEKFDAELTGEAVRNRWYYPRFTVFKKHYLTKQEEERGDIQKEEIELTPEPPKKEANSDISVAISLLMESVNKIKEENVVFEKEAKHVKQKYDELQVSYRELEESYKSILSILNIARKTVIEKNLQQLTFQMDKNGNLEKQK